MILGFGIDIVDAVRFKKWINNLNFINRFFAKNEIDYVFSKGDNAYLSLAACFAAKEAFGKALGTGLAFVALKDIAVLHDQMGSPFLNLTGSAIIAFEKKGGKTLHVSLSHEKNMAIAAVIIEN